MFVMQHVGLSVDNLYQNVHEILIKNEKVLGPFIRNMKCFLETRNAGTGSWQRGIPMTLVRYCIMNIFCFGFLSFFYESKWDYVQKKNKKNSD